LPALIDTFGLLFPGHVLLACICCFILLATQLQPVSIVQCQTKWQLTTTQVSRKLVCVLGQLI
jgi:hypothetical protein